MTSRGRGGRKPAEETTTAEAETPKPGRRRAAPAKAATPRARAKKAARPADVDAAAPDSGSDAPPASGDRDSSANVNDSSPEIPSEPELLDPEDVPPSDAEEQAAALEDLALHARDDDPEDDDDRAGPTREGDEGDEGDVDGAHAAAGSDAPDGDAADGAADPYADFAGEQQDLDLAPANPTAALARQHLKGVLEALVFASDEPIRQVDLARRAHARAKDLVPILAELRKDYEGRGIQLDEVAGGWVFRTSARFAPFVRDLARAKPVRLSRAQVETLAIIAYRQPVTRPEIDEVRGVDSGPVLKLLLERDLVRILGKRDEPGRPLIYGTGAGFLDFFGLKSLKDLPTLQEFTELNEESRIVYEAETGETPDAFVDPGAGDPEPSDGTYDAGDGDGAAIDDPEAVLDGRASSEDDEDEDEDDEDDEDA